VGAFGVDTLDDRASGRLAADMSGWELAAEGNVPDDNAILEWAAVVCIALRRSKLLGNRFGAVSPVATLRLLVVSDGVC
jgi:hypothetical protein